MQIFHDLITLTVSVLLCFFASTVTFKFEFLLKTLNPSLRPRVQLFDDAGNGWPHGVLRYH